MSNTNKWRTPPRMLTTRTPFKSLDLDLLRLLPPTRRRRDWWTSTWETWRSSKTHSNRSRRALVSPRSKRSWTPSSRRRSRTILCSTMWTHLALTLTSWRTPTEKSKSKSTASSKEADWMTKRERSSRRAWKRDVSNCKQISKERKCHYSNAYIVFLV